MDDSWNPEPPPEIVKINREDLIGDTLFSKHWLFEVLLKLIKVDTFTIIGIKHRGKYFLNSSIILRRKLKKKRPQRNITRRVAMKWARITKNWTLISRKIYAIYGI